MKLLIHFHNLVTLSHEESIDEANYMAGTKLLANSMISNSLDFYYIHSLSKEHKHFSKKCIQLVPVTSYFAWFGYEWKKLRMK